MKALTPITDHDSRLAVELAVGISPLAEILTRHDLTKDQLKIKLRDPTFRHMVKEARKYWQSDLSVKERIRLKSQVLVEDSLLELYRMFHDVNILPASRLDAFKSMAKVAAVDSSDGKSDQPGERISISINLGDDKKVVIDGESAPVVRATG